MKIYGVFEQLKMTDGRIAELLLYEGINPKTRQLTGVFWRGGSDVVPCLFQSRYAAHATKRRIKALEEFDEVVVKQKSLIDSR